MTFHSSLPILAANFANGVKRIFPSFRAISFLPVPPRSICGILFPQRTITWLLMLQSIKTRTAFTAPRFLPCPVASLTATPSTRLSQTFAKQPKDGLPLRTNYPIAITQVP